MDRGKFWGSREYIPLDSEELSESERYMREISRKVSLEDRITDLELRIEHLEAELKKIRK